MQSARLWVWRIVAVVAGLLPFLLLPRAKMGAGLTILMGVLLIADFVGSARSASKAGKPSKPWELAFFVACGLGMMIAGCMMLLDS